MQGKSKERNFCLPLGEQKFVYKAEKNLNREFPVQVVSREHAAFLVNTRKISPTRRGRQAHLTGDCL